MINERGQTARFKQSMRLLCTRMLPMRDKRETRHEVFDIKLLPILRVMHTVVVVT